MSLLRPEVIVELPEATALVTALAARLADEANVRLLIIKGVVATAQGLRTPRVSADVDVLVAPPSFAAFKQILGQHDWSTVETSGNARILPAHSTTYRHGVWPCELDVHSFFPGFMAPPEAVFEALWERRAHVEVARQHVPAPDPVSHAAILALHALRSPTRERSETDLDELVSLISARFGNAQREELAQRARVTGAADTLAPLLARINVANPGAGTTPISDLEDWRLLGDAVDTRSVTWVTELSGAKLSAWPRLIRRALWMSEANMLARDPAAGRSRWAMLRSRLVRLAQGARHLPRAVRLVHPLRRRRARGVRD